MRELQDPITRRARDALVGATVEVLVDGVDDDDAASPSAARTARPPRSTASSGSTGDALARPGAIVRARVTGRVGPDLRREPAWR